MLVSTKSSVSCRRLAIDEQARASLLPLTVAVHAREVTAKRARPGIHADYTM